MISYKQMSLNNSLFIVNKSVIKISFGSVGELEAQIYERSSVIYIGFECVSMIASRWGSDPGPFNSGRMKLQLN